MQLAVHATQTFNNTPTTYTFKTHYKSNKNHNMSHTQSALLSKHTKKCHSDTHQPAHKIKTYSLPQSPHN